jgi:small neutral amino acid transporter SnatA (MarC family)
MTEGPVDLATVALLAAFNPAAILVAVALVWILAALHVEAVAKPARAAGGMFVLQIVFGLVWAAIGYRFLRPASR